jgi:hypothetical protein
MMHINFGRENILAGRVSTTLKTLISDDITIINGEELYVNRILNLSIALDLYKEVKPFVKYLGVTPAFRDVIDYFETPEGETPAGFRIEYVLAEDGVLRADLVRDISYDKNGQKRPTRFLFSADTADPYEVAPISHLIANLTCNPGIIYDLFINNPKANIGKKFKTRDEVMQEIGRILGPGVDISVESQQEILEEAEKFREMLSPYRVVIKVPHTGPVNGENVQELLTGEKTFQRRFYEGATADMLRGHNLALMLREHGFKINFTLMFEPYQTALALQAKPYFINSFVRHRLFQSEQMKRLLDLYRVSEDAKFLQDLRALLLKGDYLAPKDADLDLLEVKRMTEYILKYRQFEGCESHDGLDGVRHNLQILRQCNLPDTRLIVCSMEGENMYPDIDNLLAEEEFQDMLHRLVITAVPAYLARFTSCNQVVSYQRRFMNAAKGQS